MAVAPGRPPSGLTRVRYADARERSERVNPALARVAPKPLGATSPTTFRIAHSAPTTLEHKGFRRPTGPRRRTNRYTHVDRPGSPQVYREHADGYGRLATKPNELLSGN